MSFRSGSSLAWKLACPKRNIPFFGCRKRLISAGTASNIMGFPPFCKLRAAVAKARQQRDECRIAGPEIVGRTETVRPIRLASSAQLDPKQPPRSRIEQDADENIAIFLRQAIEGKNVGGSLVPGKDIPPPTGDVSRLIEGLDQASKGCGNRFPGEGAPLGSRCQRAQMRMLDLLSRNARASASIV